MVGIGPGNPLDRTYRAVEAIRSSDTVIGYEPYLTSIGDLTEGKTLIPGRMLQEVQRCREALSRAREGAVVSLISSGDPGVYGMAGLALEIAAEESIDIPVQIVPGVTAATAAASRLGAPLTLDFACISLSDLLVEWSQIRRRLEAVAQADLVVALYNPRSRRRISQLEEAVAIFSALRPPKTPAAVTTAVGSQVEEIVVTDLARLLDCRITMKSIVTIGNTSTRRIGEWIVTPRGYRW